MFKDLLKLRPLHLFFFPLVFILKHFFSIVASDEWLIEGNYHLLVINLACSIAICFLPVFLVYKIVSLKLDAVKGSILTTALFIPFFFFQDLFLVTEEFLVGVRLRWVLPSLLIGLFAITCWIVLTKRKLITVFEVLNVMSIALVAYLAVVLVLSFDRLRAKSFGVRPEIVEFESKDRPDIFFLLLDSYTSNRSLREYYGFNNSEFTTELSRLGFEVSDQSKTPYSSTRLCIGSILNLNAIGKLDRFSNSFGIHELIRFNTVAGSLEKNGYTMLNYSIFDIGDHPKYYALSPSTSLTFINGVVNNCAIGMGLRILLDNNFYDLHLDILNKVQAEASAPSGNPRFVYAHVMAPHPPFVIDSSGGRVGFANRGRSRANKGDYIEQVKGLNQLVTGAIKQILEGSPHAIIIIMGDHGYRYTNDPEESFTVFLAYKGPNQNDLSALELSSEIFRLVFGKSENGVDVNPSR